MLTGVCAGFENATKINKNIWRIVFIIATLIFPYTAIIYILLAIFLPSEEGKASIDKISEDINQKIVIDESGTRDEMKRLWESKIENLDISSDEKFRVDQVFNLIRITEESLEIAQKTKVKSTKLTRLDIAKNSLTEIEKLQANQSLPVKINNLEELWIAYERLLDEESIDRESEILSEDVEPNEITIQKEIEPKLAIGIIRNNAQSAYKGEHGILSKTFIHIKGIGKQKEEKLWDDGFQDHKAFLINNKDSSDDELYKAIQNSHDQLANGNPNYFYNGLGSKEEWRVYGDFINETAFVDIETTGLSPDSDIITSAVIHSPTKTFSFVNGINLNELVDVLNQYSLVVTYNGKSFDIPFIEKYFKTKINSAHLDLRYILSSLGYKGGLKRCEELLSLPVREGLKDVDGFMAVLLWNYYQKTKDEKALETLLAYNFEDTVRLEWLMNEAFNQKLNQYDFKTSQIKHRDIPINPYRASTEILNQLLW